jgi:hypothetical protein
LNFFYNVKIINLYYEKESIWFDEDKKDIVFDFIESLESNFCFKINFNLIKN